MDIEKTNIEGCYVLTPKVFGDERGSFSVPFQANIMEKLGFQKNIQVNRSISEKGVLRGMHYQEVPDTQAKIVSVVKGAVMDVVIDLRKDSSTYGKYTYQLLTGENHKMLYVPRGFAHGFLCLEDDTIFEYYVDNIYSPKKDGGILWNDPNIQIPWEEWCKKYGIDFNKIQLKQADLSRPQLNDCETSFYVKYRYLVTGATGQLGYDIVRELYSRGIYDVLAFGSEEMDITDMKRCTEIIGYYKPEVIIHCAAYTNVKGAETNRTLAYQINSQGTINLVTLAKAIDAKFIYVSTDYVFDGKKGQPYEVTDVCNPINIYGASKLKGELCVKEYPKGYIVRTSWVFGHNNKNSNFIQKVLQQSEVKDKLTIVNDQIGSPTYTVDLAKFLVDLSNTEFYGIYQAHNEGYCSWYDLAAYALDEFGKTNLVEPITSDSFQDNVSRPMDSRMSTISLPENGFEPLPNWQDAVKRYIKEMK